MTSRRPGKLVAPRHGARRTDRERRLGEHVRQQHHALPWHYPDGAFTWPSDRDLRVEAGDLIYNNYVATSITAYAPDENIFFGFPQLNLESWNLPMVEPRHFGTEFNGYWLSGTIVPSRWQGGNYWADYVAGTTSLPVRLMGRIHPVRWGLLPASHSGSHRSVRTPRTRIRSGLVGHAQWREPNGLRAVLRLLRRPGPTPTRSRSSTGTAPSPRERNDRGGPLTSGSLYHH